MTFSGYCTNAELAKFLDFGTWKLYSITSYNHTVTYTLPTTTNDGISSYIISGTISATDDGTTIPTANYSVNVTTGVITFTSHPTDASAVVFKYYINREFSDSDLTDYVLRGARKVELDCKKIFRELSVTYTTDANDGLTYTTYNDSYWISLPYDVLSVTSLTVDGVSVSTTKLKIIGNKISLGDDAEVDAFTGNYNSISITVKHGITDTVLNRTEEDLRFLDIAKQVNLLASAILIYKSPIGANVALDNNYIIQKSDGTIRPELTVDSAILSLNKEYDELISLIKSSSASIV